MATATGPARTPVPASITAPQLATAKQKEFVADLVRKRDLSGLSTEQQKWLKAGNFDQLSKLKASEIISLLQQLPKATHNYEADAGLPEVPEGRYALRDDEGIVRFYRVSRPTEGRWKNFLFLDSQASDDYWPIKKLDHKRAVLALIAVDPTAAMKLYGQELGSCGVCGRTLTDETSREIGIGPVCRERLGL